MSAFVVYGICLGVGLVFTIVSATAGHLFGDIHHGDIGTGGHAEAGGDDSGVPGISFFSPTVLASFVTAFGAAGLVLSRIELTRSIWVSAPVSAAAGGGMALVTFWIFNALFQRTQSSSESHVASLAGMSATVISPIPEKGVGEIAYVQGGTRYTSPARVENGVAIAAGGSVRIKRIVGSQMFVEPSAEPAAKPAKP
jgi:membrane protein implicated in regulation of membrane protease activity